VKLRVLTLALLVVSTPLRAQDVKQAIAAYQSLDFDVAATLLRRALSQGGLDDTARIQALTYLGAAEQYRGRPDSAVAVFRRLVVLAPGYQPDTLIFPPEITRAYNDVRDGMKVAAARLQIPVRVQVIATDTLTRPPPSQAPPVAALPRRLTSAPSARSTITATGAGMVVNVRARSEAGGLPPASGTVLGMTASVRFRRFELGVRYMEGSLQTRDLVEGEAALRFVTTPWLTLHAGPHIRRYETPLGGGAERWVSWQFGARTEAPIIGTSVRGHALLWRGLGLSVNVPPGSGSTTGGEVGVTIDASGPFWFGLAYGIDQATVQGGSRRETVDALTLTAGLRRRR
jgi:hypothetical protein